jgi:hypothetical protein
MEVFGPIDVGDGIKHQLELEVTVFSSLRLLMPRAVILPG